MFINYSVFDKKMQYWMIYDFLYSFVYTSVICDVFGVDIWYLNASC